VHSKSEGRSGRWPLLRRLGGKAKKLNLSESLIDRFNPLEHSDLHLAALDAPLRPVPADPGLREPEGWCCGGTKVRWRLGVLGVRRS